MSGTQSGSDLFDLGFEDELEKPGEQQTGYDPNVEILPTAPPIGGSGHHSDIYGSAAYTMGGRETSPKLFAQASLFPQCSQLRSWKVENGIPTGIGTIDAVASEEDFVARFTTAMPKQGEGSARFKLRPLDLDGRELGQEITLIISEHHAALRQIRGTKKSAEIAQTGGVPNSFIEMMKQTLDSSQGALEAERARTQELLGQMAQERIDLATNAATGVQAISERMMEADAHRQSTMIRGEQERNKQSQDAMAAFFQSNLEMLQTDREKAEKMANHQLARDQQFFQQNMDSERLRSDRQMEEWKERITLSKTEATAERDRQMQNFQMVLEQERSRRDREGQEFRERMEMQRQESEHRRQQERDEYERKDRERRRETEEKRVQAQRELKERESERHRQHEMKLRELDIAAQRDREHAERMMQLQTMQSQKEQAGSFKETLKDAMETLKDFGVDPTDLIQKLISPPDNGGGEVLGALTKVAGSVADVVKETVKGKNQQQALHQAQMQQQMAHQQMLQQHQLELAEEDPDLDKEELERLMNSDEEDPTEIVPQLAMSLLAQKNARLAIRTLVQNLSRNPDPKWEEFITLCLTSEPAVYHYANSVSVRKALGEAGAKGEFVEKIVQALMRSPLVPDELNYGV